MNKEIWNALESMFARYPVMRAEGVDLREIDTASQDIGIPFPDDYSEFVSHYGGAIVGPYPVFGLRRAQPMGRNEGSVVEITRHFRNQRWPGTENWVIFSIDHAGNPIGFDSGGIVRISDHDAGIVEIIANSFEDFLGKRCLKLKGDRT